MGFSFFPMCVQQLLFSDAKRAISVNVLPGTAVSLLNERCSLRLRCRFVPHNIMAATTLSLLLLPLDEAGHYGSIPKVLGIALVLLLSWRVVRFTVIPLFYPADPKELPYWVPGMMKNDWTVSPLRPDPSLTCVNSMG